MRAIDARRAPRLIDPPRLCCLAAKAAHSDCTASRFRVPAGNSNLRATPPVLPTGPEGRDAHADPLEAAAT